MMPFDVRAPNGQLLEYQVLPREMYEAGKTTHTIYEKWRQKPLKDLSVQEKIQRRDDLIHARDVSEQAWHNYLDRTSQSESHVKTILNRVTKLILEGEQ